jgi:hypothetical protein
MSYSISTIQLHWREWVGISLAIAIGPLFVILGYSVSGLVFGAAASAYLLCCAIVVPLIAIFSARLKFMAWQVAIISLITNVLGDNLRLRSIQHSEIPGFIFVAWSVGTLVSLPVPLFFWLRPMTSRHRIIAGFAVAILALLLAIAVRKISG